MTFRRSGASRRARGRGATDLRRSRQTRAARRASERRRCRGRARAAAGRARPVRAAARQRAVRPERAPRGRRGRAGQARALPARARGPRFGRAVKKTAPRLTHVEWLEGLSPWPEEFGLGRMRALLASLGDPQRRFAAIHVVGTNGKTSTTLMAAALLRADGLRTGAYVSPHVRGWAERIQIDSEHADLEQALARVRPHAAGATQFEVLTAAALAEFAAQEVDVAVVEAGLGGRHDATNVLAAGVVVLTNVALEHTEVLGDTREAIAAEKLAVVSPGAVVVLGEPEWERRRHGGGARIGGSWREARTSRSRWPPPRRTSAALSIRPRAEAVRVPGRLERRGERPLEIWDGAHNLAGIGYLPSSRARPGLHDRLLDPRRQGSRCDAPGTDPARTNARRDAVAEPARAPRRGAGSARARRTSTRSRRSPIPSPRWPTHAALAGPDGRRSCDRIALLARSAIARCVEPVPFRVSVGAQASSYSPPSCSASTWALHSLRAGS